MSKQFECLCRETFPNKSQYGVHKKDCAHYREFKKVQCPGCFQVFETPAQFKEHKRTCQAYIKRPEVTCTCGHVAKNYWNLRQHQKECEIHQEDRDRRLSEVRRENAKKSIALHAQSEEGRIQASRVAKRTSARREIQLQRAERLKNWREENKKAFQKCTRAMLLAKSSPFEKRLSNLLKKEGFTPERQVVVVTAYGVKWFDLGILKTLIEVDGRDHFAKYSQHIEDLEEENWVRNQKEWSLVRIVNKKTGFREKDLKRLYRVLRSKKLKPGTVHLIGEEYKNRWTTPRHKSYQ